MKTCTKALQAKNYLSSAGQLNMTKLVDDAVAAVVHIHYHGVGRQQRRSRGVVNKSFQAILVRVGYTTLQAYRSWRDVLDLANLEIYAVEE